jgi:Short C-terminal domain
MPRNSVFSRDCERPGAIRFLSLAALVSFGGPLTLNAQPGTVPVIEYVTPMSPEAHQTIVITGHNFGVQAPFDGDSPSIMISDLTRDWRAGCRGRAECGPGDNRVTVQVSAWRDTEIRIEGFTGTYGANDRLWLRPGDEIEVWVWNADTDAGPSGYRLKVGPGAGAAIPPAPGAPPVPPPPALDLTTPVYAFNGAYAAYRVQSRVTSVPFTENISYVDPVRRTYRFSTVVGGAFAHALHGEITSFGERFSALSRAEVDSIRQGSTPQGFPEAILAARHNVTVSVPAGTFRTEQITLKSGSMWLDSGSGVLVRIAGRDLVRNVFGEVPGVDDPNAIAELVKTNVPMSAAYSSNVLIYGLLGLGVLVLVGAVTYLLTRGGKRSPTAAPQAAYYEGPSGSVSPGPRAAQVATPPPVPEAGPGGSPSSAANARTPAPVTLEGLEKLAKLKSLMDSGLITREEFEREKARLLSKG